MKKRNFVKPKLLYVLFAVAILTFPMMAYSAFISPPRVIIDANEAAGEMVILNRSNKTEIYSFKWQDRAMDEHGKIAEGDDTKNIKGYRSAADVLVYSPRQVILGPGESQRVRFFVKRDKMTEGEYRSHILISGRPAKEEEKKPVEGLGGQIGIIAQAGIPVMVRQGKTTVEIEPQLFELVKENGRDYLHAKFINKSTRTIYAKPTLICQRAGQEEPDRIDFMAIRMYHEAVYFDEKLVVREEDPNLEGCQSMSVEFTDRLDFEYANKPFYTQILK